MTDAQDLVLDALVGAELGPNLPDSPLTVAARLFGGTRLITFGGVTNYSAMSEIARRLGWPVMVADAVQGGVRAIQTEEDRRRFAMTVFRLLPVGGTPPKLSKPRMARIAAHSGLSVHPLVCTDPVCEWPVRLAALAASPADVTLSGPDFRCRTVAANWQPGFVDPSKEMPRWERFKWMSSHILTAFRDKPKSTAGFALRELVKLTVTEQGISAAVALIVDIARRCGLATEAL